MANALRAHWTLDPEVVFLNHGSFGACPRRVLERQEELRAELEREPVFFFRKRHEALLDEALTSLGALVGASPECLAAVTNATSGVATVVESLRLSPGDELLTTDHAYNACRQVLEAAAAGSGARVVVAPVPFPLASEDDVVEPVLAAVSPRTRLLLIDHVTSPTALVFPVERIVRALADRGIDTLVDGAHAPGMLPLHLDQLGAAYYTGNCHKWLCAPKGAAFLHVRKDRLAGVRPLVISHGANSTRTDRSRFRLLFDWPGTHDPTAFLAVPESIRFLASLFPGGFPALLSRNHAEAVAAGRLLGEALGIKPPAPESMLGAMAALPLRAGPPRVMNGSELADPLAISLFEEHHIEVPVFAWPAPRGRILRVSLPAYADLEDIGKLRAALKALGSS